MISDIDLSDGREGPIWISKSDKAKMPNFEYVASNGRGQIFLCAFDFTFLHFLYLVKTIYNSNHTVVILNAP